MRLLVQKADNTPSGPPDLSLDLSPGAVSPPSSGGSGEGVTLVIGRQDGRAAAFPSVLAQVRSGAASEHDEGGDHALARGAESSARRTRLSQANADRTLFRGFRLSCAKDRRRPPDCDPGGTAARTRRRMRRSRTPRGMHGFDARDFAFFDFPTSSSSADCRSSSSAFVRRCARHELSFREARQVAPTRARKTGTRR
jgi:hypothetical protein